MSAPYTKSARMLKMAAVAHRLGVKVSTLERKYRLERLRVDQFWIDLAEAADKRLALEWDSVNPGVASLRKYDSKRDGKLQ